MKKFYAIAAGGRVVRAAALRRGMKQSECCFDAMTSPKRHETALHGQLYHAGVNRAKWGCEDAKRASIVFALFRASCTGARCMALSRAVKLFSECSDRLNRIALVN